MKESSSKIDPALIASELPRGMREDVALLRSELNALFPATPDAHEGRSSDPDALMELWQQIRTARKAISDFQTSLSPSKANVRSVDHRGYPFQGGTYPYLVLAQLLDYFVHPEVNDLVRRDIYSNYSRYALILRVVKRQAIADLLISEFGLAEDAAIQAEELVREHLKTHHQFDLDLHARPAFEVAAAAAPDGTAPDPRFASIERYANRRQGEDALAFFARAWRAAPKPFYREDMDRHDPDLIPAIQERCGNINRNRRADDPKRVSVRDILPPKAPASARIEADRARARKNARRRRGQEPS